MAVTPETNDDHGLALYGGQALLDGVLFRGHRACALAVRTANGDIAVSTKRFKNLSAHLGKVPGVRGLLLFVEGLSLSFWAFRQAMDLARGSQTTSSLRGSNFRMAVVLVVSLLLAAALFALLPTFAAGWTLAGATSTQRSVAESGLRLVVLLSYGLAIGTFRPIRVGFAYHAAEHMVARAAEQGLPMTIESVRWMPRTLPWCGTTMILMALLIAGAVFPFIDLLPRQWSFLVRVASVPVIFAASVELLLWAGPHQQHLLVRPMFLVSHWFQHLTTRPPSDAQIEVALRAFHSTLEADWLALEGR